MKQQIIQILNRHIVADDTVMRFLPIPMFVAGISTLMLNLRKLSRLDLTEAQLFFGVLLSLIVLLLFIILGILLPMGVAPKNAK